MGKASKEFLSQFVRGEALKDILTETQDGKPALDMWHGGSPNIVKFDMSKMGTGEGQQVYSPGLYMAGRRGTSKSYRDMYTHKLMQDVPTKGGVIIGDVDLTMDPRKWANVQELIQYDKPKEEIVAAATKELTEYSDYLRSEANALDYNSYKKEWDEDAAIAQAERDAESWGEASYEDEMEFMHGKNWQDDPGSAEEFDNNYSFLRDDVTRTEKIYVHVTDMPDGRRVAEWSDDNIGERTFIYPAGTPNSYIEYSQLFDHNLWRNEKGIYNASPSLLERHKLAWEVAPDKFEFIDPRDIEPPTSFGGDPDWVARDNPFGSLNTPAKPQAISARRMTADGRIIEMGSPEYAHHLKAAISDIADTTLSDVDKVAYNIYQGSIPKWNTAAYGPEPDFSNLRGGLYKNRLYVNPDELLDWFEPINEQPKALQDLINKYLNTKELLDNSWGADAWLTDPERQRLMGLTGESFFKEMSKKFGRVEFRDDMAKVGMPGMLYRDWTRDFNNKRPTYNLVMYDDKLIDILERGAASAPMLGSVFGITSASLAAAALTQKPDVQSNPVLDPEIAEQFPLPQEEPGMLKEIASNPNVQAAMAHPVTQYIGQQLDNAEWLPRLQASAVEGAKNLYQGESLKDTGSQFVERMKTPYDETLDEASQYVLKKTNSPALATGTYMGGMLSDLTNWVGP